MMMIIMDMINKEQNHMVIKISYLLMEMTSQEKSHMVIMMTSQEKATR